MAKAALWPITDAEARKRGEQRGLDTPVVHAANDVHLVSGAYISRCGANALSEPPEEYGRKAKTQEN